MPPRVKEIDRGWKKIVKRFLGPKYTASKVGIQGTKAGEKYEDGPTNVAVMAGHEFGVPKKNLPERAPMRSTFDKNLKKYEKELGDVGRRMADGTETAEQGLNMLGETYRGDIIARIQGGEIKPPLSPAYLARKKPAEPAPLLRTGQLINALSVELEKK